MAKNKNRKQNSAAPEATENNYQNAATNSVSDINAKAKGGQQKSNRYEK